MADKNKKKIFSDSSDFDKDAYNIHVWPPKKTPAKATPKRKPIKDDEVFRMDIPAVVPDPESKPEPEFVSKPKQDVKITEEKPEKVAPQPQKVPQQPQKATQIPQKAKTQSWYTPYKTYIKFFVYSLGIFALLFLVLNWSAYSKIFISKWEKFTGADQEESPMEVFVEDEVPEVDGELLEISQNPELEKKKIPDLELDIYPSDTRIIIPRIDQNIPVVKVSKENLLKRDWGALEQDIQEALRSGVVHYPGTAFFGESGNIAITGHSSYYPWDPGRFKDVFALLHDLQIGDTVIVYSDQRKYTYNVNNIEIVLPENVDVLKPTEDDRLTLITCTPVGTNLKRLIVYTEEVSVEP